MGGQRVGVVVTGVGVISPFGVGQGALWQGVLSGRSTASRVESCNPGEYPSAIGCQITDDDFDPREHIRNRKQIKTMSRAAQIAVSAASLAIEDGAVDFGALDPRRCGVALGAGGVGLHDLDHLARLLSIGRELIDRDLGADRVDVALRHMNPLTPLKMLPNVGAAHIAIEHGLRGENLTVCTACTSGTQAIGEAVRILRSGYADLMLAGAADAMINPVGLVGFGMLGVLSRRNDEPERASRPFDRDRDGFVMGEGGAMFVLETEEHAIRRGARIMAHIEGYGSCSDAWRITDEREDGGGCVDAMQRALDDAGVRPEQIDYVNVHGTGTPMNDRTEVRAIREVFGAHADVLPVSSTKSQIGHLVAAAGAVELAVSILALQHQVLPPTVNLENQDPDCDLDVVPNQARPAEVNRILKNSFGFGGQNACLVVRGGETLS